MVNLQLNESMRRISWICVLFGGTRSKLEPLGVSQGKNTVQERCTGIIYIWKIFLSTNNSRYYLTTQVITPDKNHKIKTQVLIAHRVIIYDKDNSRTHVTRPLGGYISGRYI